MGDDDKMSTLYVPTLTEAELRLAFEDFLFAQAKKRAMTIIVDSKLIERYHITKI